MTAATITAARAARRGTEKTAPRIMPRAAANRKAKKPRTFEEQQQASPLQFIEHCGCALLVSGCELLELVV